MTTPQEKTEEYLAYRKELFESTVLDMVEHICEELTNDKDNVTVVYTVNDNKASLKVLVPKENLKDLIGRRSETLIAIKKLAFCVANKHEFYLTIHIDEI